MQQHLISPAPTVPENPTLKSNWSLVLYLKAFINRGIHALPSAERPSSRPGCPVPPRPAPTGSPGALAAVTLPSRTAAAPAKQTSRPSPCRKQVNQQSSFFCLAVKQNLADSSPLLAAWRGECHHGCCHTAPRQAVTQQTATVSPWLLLTF